MDNKHHKHPPLTRLNPFHYHHTEWAIYGTNCNKINRLVETIVNHWKDKFRLIYIDADHSGEAPDYYVKNKEKKFTANFNLDWEKQQDLISIPPCDIVLVNGNHYPASRQIVIIDENKKESLKRRIEQLSCIDILILPNRNISYFSFLQGKVSEQTQILYADQIDQIIGIMEEKSKRLLPSLKGLVLAGGASRRMGQDKANMQYHQLPQELHMAKMMEELNIPAYISKAHNYPKDHHEGYKIIKDRMIEMGPFGAIVSALMTDPNAAWLVVACDLPLLNISHLNKLIKNRAPGLYATATHGKNQEFPEPLITIYEPKSYQRFMEFLSQGYACPRKVLINSDIKVIHPDNENYIRNANTQEEALAIKNLIPS